MHQQFKYSLWLILSIGLSACSSSEPVPEEIPIAQVSIHIAQQQNIDFIENLPGRVQAYRMAEIRPQVGGIIEKVIFSQGSEVKAGQALFKINAEIFQADVQSNAAALSKAQAELKRLKAQTARYAALLPSHAISQQEYQNSEAAYQQAQAEVAQFAANLSRQQLNLQYATIRAPISGRIGKVLITEGALVNSNDSNALAVVQQIDKVYVDVKQSLAEYERLQDRLQQGELQTNNAYQVEILNQQGQAYPVRGQILFSDSLVDPDTGDVTIRVLVDNAQRRLLPGMYVRVRMNRAALPQAITIPELAVQRGLNGQTQVWVIDAQKKAQLRPIILGQFAHGYYVVQSGLKVGEVVVVEGQERILPDQVLKTVTWRAPVQSTNSIQAATTSSTSAPSASAISGATP